MAREAERGRQAYEHWKASIHMRNAELLPSWDTLAQIAESRVDGKPIPFDERAYVQGPTQEALLGLVDGGLPSDLSAISMWISESVLAGVSTPDQLDSPGPAPLAQSRPGSETEGLAVAEILDIRGGKYGPTLLDIPAWIVPMLAVLILQWLRDAVALLRAGRGTLPVLLWAPRLILSKPADPSNIAWKIRMARQGRWRTILDDVESRAKLRVTTRPTSAKHLAIARAHFANGEVTKALATLGRVHSGTPAQAQPTEAQVRSLFPEAPEPLPAPHAFSHTRASRVSDLRKDIERAAEQDNRARNWEGAVRQAIMRPKHSCAHGPDGLRYSHLRQLLVIPDVGPQLQLLVEEFVDLVASGRYCPSLQDLSLTAIAKPQGGIRPIGVSSVWRRIAMFVASTRLHGITPMLVQNGQLATTTAGPQLFARRTQRCASEGLVVARLDVRNAYGCTDRLRLIRLLDELISSADAASHETGALRAVRAAYGASEEIFWKRGQHAPVVFSNERGITQGCPTGSFTFGLVMADVLARTKLMLVDYDVTADPLPGSDRPLPSGTDVGYAALHDDVVIASADQSSLLSAIRAFTANLATAGLELGIGDGKSVLLVDDDVVLLPELLEELGNQRTSVAKCAGIPVHVPAARPRASEMLVATVQERLKPLDALHRAEPQDIVKTLIVAGPQSRIQYLESLTPGSGIWPAQREEADLKTRSLLTTALGEQAPATSELQYLFALLPASAGGFGIKSCMLEGQLVRRAARVLDAHDTGSADALEDAKIAVDKARGEYYRQLVAVSREATKHDVDALVQLSHQSRHEVNAVLTNNASQRDGNRMAPRTAAMALAMYLLTPPFPCKIPCGEPRHFRSGQLAGEVPCVGVGVHHLTCPFMTTRRHNACCSAIANLAHSVTGRRIVKLEQAFTDDGEPYDAAHRPAGVSVGGDMVVRLGGGPNVAFDLVVSMRGSLAKREARAVLEGRARQMLIVDAANKEKLRPGGPGEEILRKGVDFRPLAFSAYGASDHTTKASIVVLARAIDSHHMVPPALGRHSLARRIQDAVTCTILEQNARFALSFGPEPAPTEPEAAFGTRCPRLRAAIRAKVSARWREPVQRALFLAPDDAHGAAGSPAEEDPNSHSDSEDTPAATRNPIAPPMRAAAADRDDRVAAMARMVAEGLPSLVEAHDADHAHPEDDEPNHYTASSEDDTSDSAAANGPRPAHPQTAETASASSSPSDPRESLDWREINRESCATRRANAMSSSRTITSPRPAARAALRASEQRRRSSRRTPSSDTRRQQNRFLTDPQRSERNSGFVNSAAQVIPSASCDGARLASATTGTASSADNPRARTVLPSTRPSPAAPPAVGYGQHHRDLTVPAATAGRANRSLGGCSDVAASLAATDRSRRLAPGGGGRVDIHGS